LSLPVPPTIPPINVTFPFIGVYQLDISWTRGNGEYCMAFLHQGPGIPSNPLDGMSYQALPDWNMPGTELGSSDYFCIYDGTGNSVTVTNLLPTTNYWVVVYEYNGTGIYTRFLVNGAEGNATTLDPTVPVELSSFTAWLTAAHFVDIRWTTQSETDAMGYNVYRNDTQDMEVAYLVNPYMIPATNTSMEAHYNFLDQEATPGTWYYWLENKNISGTSDFFGPISITITDGTNGTLVPEINSLSDIYPNPFNPVNSVLNGRYELSKAENVLIGIYNIRGQKVCTIASGVMNAGAYPIEWNGKDDQGNNATPGVYFLMMTSNGSVATRKLMLIK
jgi:hypothetical protein